MRRLLLLGIVFGIASCGDADRSAAPDVAVSQAPSVEAVDMWAEAKLVADPDGVLAKGRKLQRFGTTRAEVEAMATEAFGASGERSRNDECGIGPMDFTQYGPLQLAFLDDKFVGWYLREGKGAITSDGVPVGWSLEALRTEREVRDLSSTLDGEFLYTTKNYGTITGFSDADGTITALAAGMTCFFR